MKNYHLLLSLCFCFTAFLNQKSFGQSQQVLPKSSSANQVVKTNDSIKTTTAQPTTIVAPAGKTKTVSKTANSNKTEKKIDSNSEKEYLKSKSAYEKTKAVPK